jgi:hypothetical protein
MPRFTVTVRYGTRPVRYHTFELDASDVAAALTAAGREVPDEMRERGDLVELRRAPEAHQRG